MLTFVNVNITQFIKFMSTLNGVYTSWRAINYDIYIIYKIYVHIKWCTHRGMQL